MRLLPLILIALSSGALAKNYALVMGGLSRGKQSKSHEFSRFVACATNGLRAKDYETTTLFGSIGAEQKDPFAALKGKKSLAVSPTIPEKEKYKADYDYMQSKLGVTSGATEKAIDEYFTKLSKQVKAGDKVEIAIFAHGHSECEDSKDLSSTGPADDLSPECQHTMDILGPDGRSVRYPSSRLIAHVADLEAKGALPNLVLFSCFSGRAKRLFKNLKQTCSFTLSGGDHEGFACFEDDKPGSQDHTSTGEIMTLRYCENQLEKLREEGPFKDSACEKKVSAHVQSHRQSLDLTTMDGAYWTGRRWDRAFQEPGISGALPFEYFSRSHFGHPLASSHKPQSSSDKLRPENLRAGLEQLVSRFADRPEVKDANRTLDKTVDAYNASIDAQTKLMESAGATPDEKTFEQMKVLQSRTEEIARRVVESERKLVDLAWKLGKQEQGARANDPCARTL